VQRSIRERRSKCPYFLFFIFSSNKNNQYLIVTPLYQFPTWYQQQQSFAYHIASQLFAINHKFLPNKILLQCWKEISVEPRFTNLIRFWRLFVTRNVRKPKLCVLSESYTATDALPPIPPACRQPLLPA
jgi:hypothetical protein